MLLIRNPDPLLYTIPTVETKGKFAESQLGSLRKG